MQRHSTLQAFISELLKGATIPFDIDQEPVTVKSDDHSPGAPLKNIVIARVEV